MSSSPDAPSDEMPGKPPRSADDVLPPVEPPSVAFLLQLFLIPLFIVSIIVLVWLMFSWLAHLGSDPTELVRSLRTLNESSWQKAYTLSNLLRNPENDQLKDNAELSQELATVLKAEIEDGQMGQERVWLRVFLCRALGEFRVANGLPVLLEAATTERDEAELDVRYAALEALAVLAKNVDDDALREDPQLLEVLQEVSRERSAEDRRGRRGELRSAAAFALGVVGGEQALDRLERMLEDPHANARYNAATGLARHGDLRAAETLLEMLDPENEQAVRGEVSPSEKERKRVLVMMNALRATRPLIQQNPASDLDDIKQALTRVQHADVPGSVQLQAQEALSLFKTRGAGL